MRHKKPLLCKGFAAKLRVMKVLHMMAGADKGGAETAFVELCAAQKQAGFDVAAACRASKRNMILRDAHVPLTELPFGGVFDFKTKRALKNLIADVKPRIVVTWMNRAAKKLPKIRRSYKWVARLGGYYDLKYYEGVDHFVVNAPDIARWMQDQGIDVNRITFIPNFAEIDESATPADRNVLETSQNDFVFLTLARLHPNKAIDTLLSAFADVPDAILWIAGDGPERTKLEKQARDLNLESRVRFLGWRDDRWSLLAACDAVVFPSRHEPFGNSFMQAWGAERALITTASQGPSYYVQDGVDALVVPIDDSEALSKAMNRIVKTPYLKGSIASAGKLRYAQVFDKNVILEQWRELFDRMDKSL